jgi:hypothetical protein
MSLSASAVAALLLLFCFYSHADTVLLYLSFASDAWWTAGL